MAYEQKDGDGVLFFNTKRTKDTHPNYNGNIRIGGVDYWLNGWVKKNQDGSFKLMSLSAKPKEGAGSARREDAPRQGGNAMAVMDDDIPFAPKRR